MKQHARVVIIGGGVLGAGLLYFLTKEGWNDIVLVEKGELTSGSTWHAAGLIPHFIGGLSMAKVHQEAPDLYRTLEAETGQATGWHGCGAIRLGLTDDEVDWFHYVKGILDTVGSECHLISPAEILKLHPLLVVDDVKMGFYTPNDGHTDPASATNAMAAGARQGGAAIYRHTRVTGTRLLENGEWEVTTDKGTIVCEHVVNAAGSFAKQIGEWVGLDLPIVNMQHHYLVTENLAEVEALDREPPVVRDPKASCYYRQEQQGILIGPYERANAQAWGLDGIDWSFDMELLSPALERLETSLEHAAERIPCWTNAGIKRVVNGPITHTPDGGFLLGPAEGLRNYWLCCGASIGITQGPGCGKYLAQWLVHGQTEINVRDMDPRRYGKWASGDYAIAKSIDEYQQMYQPHLPGEYREAGRPTRVTPLYEKLKQAGAVYADTFGWERAKWYAPKGVEEEYGFRRTNSFEAVGEECRAVREAVGLTDLSSFAKYEVTGDDAFTFLERVCANRVPAKSGGVVLSQMLTTLGGIESEATVTRLAKDHYYLLSGAVAELHDFDWLVQHIGPGEDVTVRNITDDFGVLVVTGPQSREVLAALTDAGLANEDGFTWMSAQEITVAGIDLRALRVSYVGELGWELHCPMEKLSELDDALMQAGQAHGIRRFGTYAMNSLRLEKAYKGWGSELTTEISLVEADMLRFARKPGGYIGADVVEHKKKEGVPIHLVYCEVDAKDADPMGNEPVLDGEKIIGITTSGGYGHAVQKSLAFAYVNSGYESAGTTFDVRILGERRKATVLAEAAWDPANERLKN
ncbi:MAG: FAD-dependent oxidoreductase [Arenicellales bacterium]|jgi:dimethylglycine dehydrogenase|nr:FAD-dependent oxidoreductase [Arenicellales bacterium]